MFIPAKIHTTLLRGTEQFHSPALIDLFDYCLDAPDQISSGSHLTNQFDEVSFVTASVSRENYFWIPLQFQSVKKKIGGSRSGAGRKPLDLEQSSVTVTLRLTQSQKTKLKSLGGGRWLREQLDLF